MSITTDLPVIGFTPYFHYQPIIGGPRRKSRNDLLPLLLFVSFLSINQSINQSLVELKG